VLTHLIRWTLTSHDNPPSTVADVFASIVGSGCFTSKLKIRKSTEHIYLKYKIPLHLIFGVAIVERVVGRVRRSGLHIHAAVRHSKDNEQRSYAPQYPHGSTVCTKLFPNFSRQNKPFPFWSGGQTGQNAALVQEEDCLIPAAKKKKK